MEKLIIKLKKEPGYIYSQNHLFSKTEHWSYENEYRFLLTKKYNQGLKQDYPYDFYHKIPFNKESIHSIILGEKIEPENAEMIEKIIQNLNTDIPLKIIQFDRKN